jgi:hypothetical protein
MANANDTPLCFASFSSIVAVAVLKITMGKGRALVLMANAYLLLLCCVVLPLSTDAKDSQLTALLSGDIKIDPENTAVVRVLLQHRDL